MSAQITLAGEAGRTVFRDTETIDILVELTGSAGDGRQLQGVQAFLIPEPCCHFVRFRGEICMPDNT